MKKSPPQKKFSREKTGPQKTAGHHGSKKKTAALNNPNITELRQQAEARLNQEMGRLDALYNNNTKQIIHEIGTYQIELEMKNEEFRKTQAELEASYLKYVNLYEFAPVGYFTLTPKGIIKSVNLTGAKMLGTTKKELVKKNFSVFLHENDADTFYLFVHSTIREEAGQRHITEVRFQTNEGNILHIQLEGITFKDDAGNVYEMRVTATDITVHVEAEKTIRQLARFPAENPFPVIRLNKEGVILYANRASSHLLDQWQTNTGEPVPPEIMNLIGEVRESGKILEIEQRCGSRTLTLNLVPIFDGSFVNVYGYDITDRKRAEKSTRDSEAQLEATLNNLMEAVIVSDLDGNLVYWNPAAVKLFDFTSEEEYLKTVQDFQDTFELSSPEEGILPLDRWPISRILRGVSMDNLEIKIRRLDIDWERFFAFSGTLARDKNNKPIQAILALSDITDRKTAEMKIRLQNAILTGMNFIFKAGIQCETDEELAEETLSIAEQFTGSGFGFIGEIGQNDLLHDTAMTDPGWQQCKMIDKSGHKKPPGNFRIAAL